MGSKARTMARAARRPKQSELIGDVLRKMAASIDGNTRMIAELERVVQEHEERFQKSDAADAKTKKVVMVRERASIVDVIREHIPLDGAGPQHKTDCPFCKVDSFCVDANRQFFHCYGCGKSGDVITFLRLVKGIGFDEALEELAKRYEVNE
jgi:hypothetical protein